MATYNQVITGLEQIATNHRQINTFGFGDIWEIATSGDIIYPLMWADGEGVSVDIEAKTETYNFSILFMDVVKNGEINENEVLSDQLSIAKDVLAQLKHPNYPWTVSGGGLEDFTERFTDSVSGWRLSVSLILPFTSDRCVMPYEGNTSFPTTGGGGGGGGGAVSGVSSIVGTAGIITVLPASTGDVTVNIDPTYVGQTSITTLGTIGTGVWQGSIISTSFTDAKIKTVTGVPSRITISGTSTDPVFNISPSYVGQSSIFQLGTITIGQWEADVISTDYTEAQIITVTGTLNRLSITGTATDPVFDIDSNYVGQTSITTLGTITTGVWNGSVISTAYTEAKIKGGGTLNFIPKFTPDGVTLGDSLIFDNGTNVGVREISPSATLHVKGTSDSSLFALKVNSLNFSLIQLGNDGITFVGDTSRDTYLWTQSPAGRMGISNANGLMIWKTHLSIDQAIYFGTVDTGSGVFTNYRPSNGNWVFGEPNASVFGADDANSKIWIQGKDATSSNYGLRVSDSAANNLFRVRNDGWVEAPTSLTTPLLIGGTAVGSFIQHKSTTANGTSTALATQFTGGNNGATTIASLYNDAQVIIGSGTHTRNATAFGILRIAQGTSNIDIGEQSSGISGIWLNQASNTGANFILRGNASSAVLNSPAANIDVNIAIGGTNRYTFMGQGVSFSPTTTTGGNVNFLLTASAGTNQTAGTELSTINYNLSATLQHASNTSITTSRDFLIQARTHSFATATGTITNAATLAITGAPIAGTNAIITNRNAIWVQSGAARFDGSLNLAYVAQTANYTIVHGTDYLIDCTANSFTVTLPTAVGFTGRVYQIKNSTGGSTITVNTTSSQTIDGITSQTVPGSSAMLVMSNGANWIII